MKYKITPLSQGAKYDSVTKVQWAKLSSQTQPTNKAYLK